MTKNSPTSPQPDDQAPRDLNLQVDQLNEFAKESLEKEKLVETTREDVKEDLKGGEEKKPATEPIKAVDSGQPPASAKKKKEKKGGKKQLEIELDRKKYEVPERNPAKAKSVLTALKKKLENHEPKPEDREALLEFIKKVERTYEATAELDEVIIDLQAILKQPETAVSVKAAEPATQEKAVESNETKLREAIERDDLLKSVFLSGNQIEELKNMGYDVSDLNELKRYVDETLNDLGNRELALKNKYETHQSLTVKALDIHGLTPDKMPDFSALLKRKLPKLTESKTPTPPPPPAAAAQKVKTEPPAPVTTQQPATPPPPPPAAPATQPIPPAPPTPPATTEPKTETTKKAAPLDREKVNKLMETQRDLFDALRSETEFEDLFRMVRLLNTNAEAAKKGKLKGYSQAIRELFGAKDIKEVLEKIENSSDELLKKLIDKNLMKPDGDPKSTWLFALLMGEVEGEKTKDNVHQALVDLVERLKAPGASTPAATTSVPATESVEGAKTENPESAPEKTFILPILAVAIEQAAENDPQKKEKLNKLWQVAKGKAKADEKTTERVKKIMIEQASQIAKRPNKISFLVHALKQLLGQTESSSIVPLSGEALDFGRLKEIANDLITEDEPELEELKHSLDDISKILEVDPADSSKPFVLKSIQNEIRKLLTKATGNKSVSELLKKLEGLSYLEQMEDLQKMKENLTKDPKVAQMIEKAKKIIESKKSGGTPSVPPTPPVTPPSTTPPATGGASRAASAATTTPWTPPVSASSAAPTTPWTPPVSASSAAPTTPWTPPVSASSAAPTTPWTPPVSASSAAPTTPWTPPVSSGPSPSSAAASAPAPSSIPLDTDIDSDDEIILDLGETTESAASGPDYPGERMRAKAIDEFITRMGLDKKSKEPAMMAIRSVLSKIRPQGLADLEQYLLTLNFSGRSAEDLEEEKTVKEVELKNLENSMSDKRQAQRKNKIGTPEHDRINEEMTEIGKKILAATSAIVRLKRGIERKMNGKDVQIENPEQLLGAINMHFATQKAGGKTPEYKGVLALTLKQLEEAKKKPAGKFLRTVCWISNRVMPWSCLKPRLPSTLRIIAEKEEVFVKAKIAPEKLAELAELHSKPDGVKTWLQKLQGKDKYNETMEEIVPALLAHLSLAVNDGRLSNINTVSLGHARSLVEILRKLVHEHAIEHAKKHGGGSVDKVSAYFDKKNSIEKSAKDRGNFVMWNSMKTWGLNSVKVGSVVGAAATLGVGAAVAAGGGALGALALSGPALIGAAAAGMAGPLAYASWRLTDKPETKAFLRRTATRFAAGGALGGLALAATPWLLPLAIPGLLAPEVWKNRKQIKDAMVKYAPPVAKGAVAVGYHTGRVALRTGWAATGLWLSVFGLLWPLSRPGYRNFFGMHFRPLGK